MMKRKNFILLIVVLFVGIFSFTGCSTQKNYNMSYEQVISILEDQSKEMMEIFFNFDTQEKNMKVSTKLDTGAVNFDLNLTTQSRVDYDSMMQDLSLSFDSDIKIQESNLDFMASGALDYSMIGDNVYLKLSKFSLKGPSAKDLAMVTMIVNSFKGQWFKLGLSGLNMNMSKTFNVYELYNEKLGEFVDNAGKAMINQGSGIYDGIFDEYKGYNAWKYSVDEDKVDEMLHMYVDMMNGFYSGWLVQYAENLSVDKEEMGVFDFNTLFSGITYDNLQGYFVIVGKNDIVETMEDAHININGTGIVFNYYYGKDGLYFEAKTENGEDVMLIVAKKNGKIYTVYANISSILGVKGDLKFNKFSKKDGIDVDFDVEISMNTEDFVDDDNESSKNINIDIPFKGNYKVRNIDKFALKEPSDAVDLMELIGDYLGGNNNEDEYLDDSEYLDEGYEVVGADELQVENTEIE